MEINIDENSPQSEISMKSSAFRSSTKMDYYRSNVNKNKYCGLKSPKEYSESNATSFCQEQRIYSPISHSTQKHNYVANANSLLLKSKINDENCFKSRAKSILKMDSSIATNTFSPLQAINNIAKDNYLNTSIKDCQNPNDLNSTKNSMKVININLDKIREELENAHKNGSKLKNNNKNEDLSQFLTNEPLNNSMMNQLSPHQREEIMKIRQEGCERRKLLLDQIGKFKDSSKCSNENSINSETNSPDHKLTNSMISKDHNIIEIISHNELEKKFRKCETRLDNFETTISEILSFTKQTRKDTIAFINLVYLNVYNIQHLR